MSQSTSDNFAKTPGNVIYMSAGEPSLYVSEDEKNRYLTMGGDAIHTAIDKTNPRHMPLDVYQSLLSGLMFLVEQKPSSALLGGCGGGAVARYLDAFEIPGQAVEFDSRIADIAKQYFDFPVSWSLHLDDIQSFVSTSKDTFDIILMDIADGDFSPEWLCSVDFLTKCKARLKANGMFSMNYILKDVQQFHQLFQSLRQVFGQRVVFMSVVSHINVIVHGFNGEIVIPEADSERLKQCEAFWQLPFSAFLLLMQKDTPPGSGIFD